MAWVEPDDQRRGITDVGAGSQSNPRWRYSIVPAIIVGASETGWTPTKTITSVLRYFKLTYFIQDNKVACWNN
jgi:hypothetical protein